MQITDQRTSRPPLGGIVWTIFLNATIPVILYRLSRRYLSLSDFAALAIAATFPIGKSTLDVARRRQVDPISIMVLLGIVTDGAALFFGGSVRLLLVRESFFTGAFGLACFISLLLPRPVMFYFARHFVAGTDLERQARFNAAWQLREVRFCHRLITAIWGAAFVGELILRIILIYNVSPATVLVVSPILLGTLTLVTMIWAFSYGHRVRLRALVQLNQVPNRTVEDR
jgi:uncharacterized membrane protein